MCLCYLFSAKTAWQLVNRKADFFTKRIDSHNESIRIANWNAVPGGSFYFDFRRTRVIDWCICSRRLRHVGRRPVFLWCSPVGVRLKLLRCVACFAETTNWTIVVRGLAPVLYDTSMTSEVITSEGRCQYAVVGSASHRMHSIRCLFVTVGDEMGKCWLKSYSLVVWLIVFS